MIKLLDFVFFKNLRKLMFPPKPCVLVITEGRSYCGTHDTVVAHNGTKHVCLKTNEEIHRRSTYAEERAFRKRNPHVK